VASLPGTGDPGIPFADADIDRVLVIDRDEVRHMALKEPMGVRADEAGREQAQSLLEDLRILVSPVPAPIVTADPITAFAPLVHLHSREKLWPVTAETFLDNSWLGWSHDDGCADWVPDGSHLDEPDGVAAAKGRFDPAKLSGPAPYEHVPADEDCRDKGGAPFKASDHTRPYDTKGPPARLGTREGFYLDLDDRMRGGTRHVYEEPGLGLGQSVYAPLPVYYERADEKVDGRPGFRVTYWIFYALSQPPRPATEHFVHEGDWERISVLVAAGEEPGQYLPVSVRYHAHDRSRHVPWVTAKRVGTAGSDELTHPVVFSARGSHASYWRAGRFENVFVLGGRRHFAVFDDAIACPRCPQWRTWESLLSAKDQPWYGFGGSWGALGASETSTGRTGPSHYMQDPP
jgi:hypothetical protein